MEYALRFENVECGPPIDLQHVPIVEMDLEDARRLSQRYCADCGWPEGKPVPDGPLCSICRRRDCGGKHERE